jgi:hypothetical protein
MVSLSIPTATTEYVAAMPCHERMDSRKVMVSLSMIPTATTEYVAAMTRNRPQRDPNNHGSHRFCTKTSKLRLSVTSGKLFVTTRFVIV